LGQRVAYYVGKRKDITKKHVYSYIITFSIDFESYYLLKKKIYLFVYQLIPVTWVVDLLNYWRIQQHKRKKKFNTWTLFWTTEIVEVSRFSRVRLSIPTNKRRQVNKWFPPRHPSNPALFETHSVLCRRHPRNPLTRTSKTLRVVWHRPGNKINHDDKLLSHFYLRTTRLQHVLGTCAFDERTTSYRGTYLMTSRNLKSVPAIQRWYNLISTNVEINWLRALQLNVKSILTQPPTYESNMPRYLRFNSTSPKTVLAVHTYTISGKRMWFLVAYSAFFSREPMTRILVYKHGGLCPT